MKRYRMRSRTILAAAAMTFTSLACAASDVLVDFGDSGIVVVVEASDSGKEYGVAYIPAVPDEFYLLYPALPAAPAIPWPAGWGSEPVEPDPCLVAQNHLSEIEREIVWRQETINFAEEEGFLYSGVYGDPTIHYRGSVRYEEIVTQMETEIAELKQAREDAVEAVKEYCTPAGQT